MEKKNILLILIFTITSLVTFGQRKNKKQELPLDSLYARDINEVNKTYPDIVVKEFSQNNDVILADVNIKKRVVSLKYPNDLREAGVEGTVYFRFILDTLGYARDIKIIKSNDKGFSNEVIRAMKEFGEEPFMPFKVNGKKVFLYQKAKCPFVLR